MLIGGSALEAPFGVARIEKFDDALKTVKFGENGTTATLTSVHTINGVSIQQPNAVGLPYNWDCDVLLYKMNKHFGDDIEFHEVVIDHFVDEPTFKNQLAKFENFFEVFVPYMREGGLLPDDSNVYVPFHPSTVAYVHRSWNKLKSYANVSFLMSDRHVDNLCCEWEDATFALEKSFGINQPTINPGSAPVSNPYINRHVMKGDIDVQFKQQVDALEELISTKRPKDENTQSAYAKAAIAHIENVAIPAWSQCDARTVLNIRWIKLDFVKQGSTYEFSYPFEVTDDDEDEEEDLSDNLNRGILDLSCGLFDKQALDQFFGGNEDRAINLRFTSGMQLPLSKFCFENGDEFVGVANPKENNNSASDNRSASELSPPPEEESDESSFFSSRQQKARKPKRRRRFKIVSPK